MGPLKIRIPAVLLAAALFFAGCGRALPGDTARAGATRENAAPEEGETEEFPFTIDWEKGGGGEKQTGREDLKGEVIELYCWLYDSNGKKEKAGELFRQNLDLAGVPYAVGRMRGDNLAVAVERKGFDYLTFLLIAAGAGGFEIRSAGRTISPESGTLRIERDRNGLRADVSAHSKMDLYVMTEDPGKAHPVYLTAGRLPLFRGVPKKALADGVLPLTTSCLTGEDLTPEETDRAGILQAILETEPYPETVNLWNYALDDGKELTQAPDIPETDLYRGAAEKLFLRLKDQVPALYGIRLNPGPEFYLDLPAGDDLAERYKEAIDLLQELCPPEDMPEMSVSYILMDKGSGQIHYTGIISNYGDGDSPRIYTIGIADYESPYITYKEDLDVVLSSYENDG